MTITVTIQTFAFVSVLVSLSAVLSWYSVILVFGDSDTWVRWPRLLPSTSAVEYSEASELLYFGIDACLLSGSDKLFASKLIWGFGFCFLFGSTIYQASAFELSIGHAASDPDH